jgi:hypothetical protein
MNQSNLIVDRKIELEKKRAKLEEIKKRKLQRLNVIVFIHFLSNSSYRTKLNIKNINGTNDHLETNVLLPTKHTAHTQNEIEDLLSHLNLKDDRLQMQAVVPTKNIFYKEK